MLPIWIPIAVILGALALRAYIVSIGGIGNERSLILDSDFSQTYRRPEIKGPVRFLIQFQANLLPSPGGQLLPAHVTPTSVTVNGQAVDLFNAYDGAQIALDLPTPSGTIFVSYAKYGAYGIGPISTPTATIVYGQQ